jgi:tetratricopeptide (TPR) repeat protein
LAIVRRGAAYIVKGQYDRAIEDFDQAIRLNPNYALAFISRGNAYLSKGVAACRPFLPPCAIVIAQYDRAIEDFDQAIRINPNYALAIVRRGAAYAAKDQPDRAIEDFDQAIRINPNDLMAGMAYTERGIAKSAKGDFAGAAADLAKATQLLNPSVGK